MDLDVFDVAPLRDGDGEALRVADAAGDAVDEVCEEFWAGEGDEAAHAGIWKAWVRELVVVIVVKWGMEATGVLYLRRRWWGG